MRGKSTPMDAVRLHAALVSVFAGLISFAHAEEPTSLVEGAVAHSGITLVRQCCNTQGGRYAISSSQMGAKANPYYHVDGLSVMAGANSVRLSCVFQRLEGEVTTEGLCLTSTVTNLAKEVFRVTACSVGRTSTKASLPYLLCEQPLIS